MLHIVYLCRGGLDVIVLDKDGLKGKGVVEEVLLKREFLIEGGLLFMKGVKNPHSNHDLWI